ncbi:hypothetical protein BCV72DRAFT_338549 [Rhizopus microsporus var. microsporus]|uniref:Uncharacterized protein n=2 Tax=Rhizopus microsporus TaxID=58291 RepID=A0A2G4SJ68_RHIZD|nr:uncharacterized protein RHIMIDRAFT_294886 [Rhizopus microsporus ATCC 52813]ORE02662.1 hypothetical protein BCV72DRAFT_338549 [Rhizopus microsporus var. microsporus]PHZ08792.1 hypothetical protein RHIMIDRAFT_294886 [Rhizopus microsporus ATCC 52813]
MTSLWLNFSLLAKQSLVLGREMWPPIMPVGSSVQHPLPGKRKNSKQAASSVVAAEIDTFEESDSVQIEGLEESIATWVGRKGRATAVVDRKTRYFNTLRMNGILDLFDAFESFQLSNFSVETQEKIRQLQFIASIMIFYF